ncbi:6658_t:CDS:1, partial [Acaulospora colombiana]
MYDHIRRNLDNFDHYDRSVSLDQNIRFLLHEFLILQDSYIDLLEYFELDGSSRHH